MAQMEPEVCTSLSRYIRSPYDNSVPQPPVPTIPVTLVLYKTIHLSQSNFRTFLQFLQLEAIFKYFFQKKCLGAGYMKDIYV